jgi:hypothetical protein
MRHAQAALMQLEEAADQGAMAKSSTEPSSDEQAMKPEMRALIGQFDAKDRRDEKAKKPFAKSKERRRRGDKPARAA